MKPIVQYKPIEAVTVLRIGHSAIIEPIDHQSDLVSNTKPAWTSKIVALHKGGAFETINTMYVPEAKNA